MAKDSNRFDPPGLKAEFPVSFFTGFVFMVLVLLALPLSQWINEIRENEGTEVDQVDLKPPELTEPPPPPEEEEPEEDIEDIEQEREPPTLQQLELAMNPDLSGLASSDFTVPTINMGQELQEIVYELEDLTQKPRPISQRSPIYPPELKRNKIQGTVVLEFIVRSDGSTSNIKVSKSDNPGFEEPAIRAVRRWRFEPGQKDGKAVNTRVRIPIPFTIGN